MILLLAGCGQNPAETANETPGEATVEAQAPADTAPPPAPAAEQPPPIPPNSEVAINAISSVDVSRPAEEPGVLIIRATGETASAGWTNPKLIPEAEESANPNVLIYRFVATSPADEHAGPTAQRVDTELRVPSFPENVTTLRIVAASNQITVPVAQ